MESLTTKALSLISRSTSMMKSEKHYWIRMVPYMKDEYLNQFNTIAETEEEKLQEIERRFNTTPEEDRVKEGE